jgi:hypothetical protein
VLKILKFDTKALYLSRMGKLYSKFERMADTWIIALDNYTIEELLRVPADGGWSMGQVYIHIATANKYFLGKNAEKCANGEDVIVDGKGKTNTGRLVFFLENFPPVKVKMPKKETGGVEPIQPESKEQILRKLIENKEFFKSIEERVEAAPKNARKKYPILGYLNASEWYSIGTFHMRHHLRQKKRLDKFLGK